MPATESTWRNPSLLHRLFAITGVLMTVGTVWMLYKDHFREWKNYQVKTNNIDLKMNELRQNQYDTTEATLVHQQKAEELASARAQAVDAPLIAAFKSHAAELNEALDKYADYGYGAVDFDPARVDRYARALADLAGPAEAKRAEATAAIQAAEAAAATGQTDAQALSNLEQAARQADQQDAEAEAEAAEARERLIGYLQSVVVAARTHEDKALGVRKFKSADIDAAKANVDIAIRDHLPAEQRAAREADVKRLMGQPGDAEAGRTTFNALNEVYQSISAARKAIERDLQQMTAEASAAQKAYEDSIAELERLKTQYQEREETYVEWAGPGNWNFIPLPGKKVLTMPILDAFSSPRRPENLWSEGLEQTYGSFGNVRRFDRCTTCHQSMIKTLPGQPTTPSYVKAESFEVIVTPPAADALPQRERGEDGQELPLTLEDLLGVRLADEGILNRDDATVALVLPKSPAASAQMVSKLPPTGMVTGSEIRESVAQLVSQPGSGENLYPLLPGLMVGDVIEGINGEVLFGGNRGSKRVEAMLTLLAQSGEPIRLTIRRGLPNPFVSHPRLDLFLSDNSPHAMQTFGCTVCHEGQGSATDFRWASHTPNTMLDMQRWTDQHGWFDNPHWIFPMHAKRFAESSCLKCHHDVVELEPSEQYPEAPAPKVTHGYHLIRKYGCYGCHEVNGFDGPDRRIGPDLRSEPNYFAVAQQIEAELVRAEQTAAGNDSLNQWKEQLGSLTGPVAAHPEDDAARDRLRTTIEEQVAAAGEEKAPLDRSLASLANMLRDVETPGDQRRPGPSLRFLNRKVDPVFLYDWISDPRHFRPTTRMPKFFGLWDHLKDGDGKVADPHGPQLEPIEIRGVVQYFQSYADHQPFEFEQRPTGIDAWSDEEKVARGKLQFQTRGCLACHNHKDFPEVEEYRDPNEIVQGPDLSNIGDKFRPDRNPAGRDWLYSWIKNPARYHVRTVMPDLFLDPEQDAAGKWFDPADDVATYLLTSTSDWQPIEAATKIAQPLAKDDPALEDLMLEHLKEAFYEDQAIDYYMNGIPPEMENELKGAEKDLIVPDGGVLSNEQRLKYIGRKTIAKYGCFGCHDVPGFEDAKPIGTGLADWGRKDPARLAFEHITHYIEHGHAVHGAQAAAEHDADATPTTDVTDRAPYADAPGKSREADPTAADEPTPIEQSDVLAHDGVHEPAEPEDFASFYTHALEAGNRIGFIYQKLKEPRSYDYEKTENKRYNERLRMPQFPFTAEEREAVVTFVLGLVADPPQAKYVYAPDERQQALVAGREVLEKYNCGGCHILGLEKWELSYPPESFGPQNEAKVYPFLRPHFAPDELAAAGTPDKRNELHATLHGLPPLDKNDGLPLVFDVDGLTLEADAEYGLGELRYAVDLYQPTTLDGSPYMTGQSPLSFPAGQVDARHPTWGGTLTKYLLPEVTKLERQSNPNASGSEAYGWLPPPLIGEGKKVQTGWLHDFLLEPYAIRPAVFLRMPKFNMSSAEATALANYFAAVDGVEYPYAYAGARDTSRLASLEAAYRQNAQQASAGSGANVIEAQPAESGTAPASVQPASVEPSTDMHRLDDAMRIVVNGNYCVKCHLVSDFVPPGSPRAKAPNLADVYRRLRPDFMRDWIANPKTILPYTSMPVNVPYDPDLPHQGGVSQDLYHGTSVEQVHGLVDLLMNFDRYTQGSTRIADMVQPVAPAPAEGTPAATGTTGGGSE